MTAPQGNTRARPEDCAEQLAVFAPTDPPIDKPAIDIRDLHVRRGGKPILPGISLQVPRGGVTGLLGPSGSGKTTLMHAIVGVQIVESGQLTILGQAAGTPALRRRAASVTEEPSVYADLTVEENLHYFCRILGAPRQRIEEVIHLVGLAGQTKQVARTLSGGEFSRASLAVALLGDPELLVLDEPTVDVDPILRRELWQTFYTLADRGATLLRSSHVTDEAGHCHELVLIRSGRIIATGTPAEYPATAHAARAPGCLGRSSFQLRVRRTCQGSPRNNTGTWFRLDIVIVAGSITLALLLGATTLRRRTA